MPFRIQKTKSICFYILIGSHGFACSWIIKTVCLSHTHTHTLRLKCNFVMIVLCSYVKIDFLPQWCFSLIFFACTCTSMCARVNVCLCLHWKVHWFNKEYTSVFGRKMFNWLEIRLHLRSEYDLDQCQNKFYSFSLL